MISRTTGTGMVTPALHAGAKGTADAVGGSVGARVAGISEGVGTMVGAKVGEVVGATVGVGCSAAKSWLRRRKNPATSTNRITPPMINPVILRGADCTVGLSKAPVRKPLVVERVRLPSCPKAMRFKALARSTALE